MSWYLRVLRKYAVFNGRAQRMEYWMFLLCHVIIIIALGFIGAIVAGFETYQGPVSTFITAILVIYVFGTAIPILALNVRRLHDTDRSGWYVLIQGIPIIGGLIWIVFMVQDSTPGENRFGANPKEHTEHSQSLID